MGSAVGNKKILKKDKNLKRKAKKGTKCNMRTEGGGSVGKGGSH